MDARNAVQRIGAILVIVAWVCSGAVYADHVPIYSGDYNLPIPSPDEPESEYGRGWMDDAIIEVPCHLVISDLDVGISLMHEGLFDLQIFLQSPAGTNIDLNLAGNLAFIVRDEDGRLHAYGGSVEWLFDDEAKISIEDATEPFIGAFRPVENLFSFDEQDAYGSWRLRIYDASYADTGTLNSFELMIETPEPASAILLTLAAVLLGLFNPRRGHGFF